MYDKHLEMGLSTDTGRTSAPATNQMLRTCFIVLVIGLVAAGGTSAQSSQRIWQIHSPEPGATVSPGGLFIALSPRPGIELDMRSIVVRLNGEDISQGASISGKRWSVLYLRPLPGGVNRMFVRARYANGEAAPDHDWTFSTPGGGAASGPGAAGAPVPGVTPGIAVGNAAATEPTRRSNPFRFVGDLDMSSRQAGISGQGSTLRQEPSQTNALLFNGAGRLGSVSFPVRVSLTSDESSLFQSRNRAMVGVEARWISVYGGDTNPNLSELALTGIRVRGVEAQVRLGPLRVTAVNGETARAVDSGTSGLDLGSFGSSLKPVSSYRRTLTAFRVALESRSRFSLGLVALRSRDDEGSLSATGSLTPQQNVVLGGEMKSEMFRGRFGLDIGAAGSLTTRDISRGAASKAEVDSSFDVDLPFDPLDFSHIFILNGSTVPLDPTELTSLTYYFKTRLQLPGNRLSAEYRSVGPSFESFGIPYLRNDRAGFEIRDLFRLARGRVSGSARFRSYRDDVSELYGNSRQTQVAGLNAAISPRQDLPRMLLGLRRQTRTAEASDISAGSDDQVDYLMGGLNWTINSGIIRHSINLVGSRSMRSDAVRPETSSSSSTIQASLNERLPRGWRSGLRYTRLSIESDVRGTIQSQNGFGVMAGRTMVDDKLEVDLDAATTRAAETAFASASSRDALSLRVRYRVQPSVRIMGRFGLSRYSESDHDDRGYTEQFAFLGLQYGFGY